MPDDEEPQTMSFGFVDELEVWDPEAPIAFPIFDETISTDSLCDSCGYVYSGGDDQEVKKCPKCGALDSGGPQMCADGFNELSPDV